ncbi:type I methionyl aminopeptidase [bacterium]|nr:type I methionyl aminopeptidase [bacterium]NCQ55217.1 type I methionyl aminopeptidase [Candidatus Parcubacteria bacterium]NCS67270.1 type I methionyl aminopeptidase [Candidatus Peregrinibacteria bacterium]NCS96525.1 type I methionyl aminopeptidase [bacterium]
MVVVKTDLEIAVMRHAGKILQGVQELLKTKIQPGITLLELDAIAEKEILKHNGKPSFKGFNGFPATLCTMINSEVVHGIPDNRELQAGDLLSVDCGVTYEGLIADAAFTVIVGGDETNPERARFSQIVKKALEAGCEQAVAGNTLGDIGYAVQRTIEAGGYHILKEFTGHGVGYEMHEDPFVLNYGTPGKGMTLKEGMTICIEPIVTISKTRTKTLKDGWTEVTVDGKEACQWEHCGVVTKSGFEIFA